MVFFARRTVPACFFILTSTNEASEFGQSLRNKKRYLPVLSSKSSYHPVTVVLVPSESVMKPRPTISGGASSPKRDFQSALRSRLNECHWPTPVLPLFRTMNRARPELGCSKVFPTGTVFAQT